MMFDLWETQKPKKPLDNNTQLYTGMQVAYVPQHIIVKYGGSAAEAIDAKDVGVDFGFVSSWNDSTVFCRFWSQVFRQTLRTTANSEGCNRRDLYAYDSRKQTEIESMLEYLRADPERWGWCEQEEREG